MPYALESPLTGSLFILPDRWQDVTLAQADALTDAADIYDTLAVLCGVAPAHVMQWPASVLTPELVECLRFLQEPMPDWLPALPVPSHLILPGPAPLGWVSLPVPQDLAAKTFGQSADLAAVLTDTSLTPYQQRAKALAIYFYSAYYRCAYDSDGVDAFAEVCAQATLAEALPLTAFFFSSTNPSAKPTPGSFGAFRSGLRRKARAWISWCKSGTWWPWSTHSVLEIKLVGRISSASRGRK